MMFLYEIFPVFLFFLAFKFYDIYAATVVGIIATLAQVIVNRFWKKAWDRKQIITLIVFIVFGSLTLYFHNPIFVKWKPTIIFWIFSLAILSSHLFTKKPLMQRLMESVVQEQSNVVIPSVIWKRINLVWAIFFLVLGGLNLYIAYNFSNNAWVNFKFYGISAALLLLSVLQAFYLMRYLPGSKHE